MTSRMFRQPSAAIALDSRICLWCGPLFAVVIGHDWGALVAWHTALLRVDLVHGVGGLSVPFSARTPVPTLTAVRSRFGDGFYQLYFQHPGVERTSSPT